MQSLIPSAQEMAGHGLSTLRMWDMCPVVFLDLAAVLGPSITGQQWRRTVANCGQHVKSGRTVVLQLRWMGPFPDLSFTEDGAGQREAHSG